MIDDVPPEISLAAKNVLILSIDSSTREKLITGNIKNINILSEEEAKDYINKNDSDLGTKINPLVVIEYETWLIPDIFDPSSPEYLAYRHERAVVDYDTLKNNKLIDHGLGHEYNQIAWDQIREDYGDIQDVNFPQDKLDLFSEALHQNRFEEIKEYLKENHCMPESLSKDIGKLYEKAYDDAKKEHNEWLMNEQLKNDEENLKIDKIIFEVEAFKITNEIDYVSFRTHSTHKSKILYIKAKRDPNVADSWNCEAELARKSTGGLHLYVKIARAFFRINKAGSLIELEQNIKANTANGIISSLLSAV